MKDKWISVKDRLPDDDNEYLVWPYPNKDIHILTACFNCRSGKWIQDYYSGYNYEDFEPIVTHWMPLPEHPK